MIDQQLLLKAKLLNHYRDRINNARDLSLYEHIINQVTSIIDIITLSKKPKFMLYDKINQLLSSLTENNNDRTNNIDMTRYTIYRLIENYLINDNEMDNDLAIAYSYYKTIEENYDKIKEYIDHFLNNPREFLILIHEIPLTEDVSISKKIITKYTEIIDTVINYFLR